MNASVPETPSSQMKKKNTRGRVAGTKNYNSEFLFSIIRKVMPTNSLLWGVVAEQYRVGMAQNEARDPADVKKMIRVRILLLL